MMEQFKYNFNKTKHLTTIFIFLFSFIFELGRRATSAPYTVWELQNYVTLNDANRQLNWFNSCSVFEAHTPPICNSSINEYRILYSVLYLLVVWNDKS